MTRLRIKPIPPFFAGERSSRKATKRIKKNSLRLIALIINHQSKAVQLRRLRKLRSKGYLEVCATVA